MRKRAFQRQHVSGRQIKDLVLHMHSDVTRDTLNRNPTGGLMFLKARIRFQDRQYNVAHERIIVNSILNLLRAFSEWG